MTEQYMFNQPQGQQIYNTDQVLYQYNIGSNPYDPLGLKGTNYTFENSSNQSSKVYSTKSEGAIILNHNQGYTQQIVYGQPTTNLQKDYNSTQYYQKQEGLNFGKEAYAQAVTLQLQNQPQIQQNIPQYQYQLQNQHQQIQIHPNQQQNLQNLQNQQKQQPQLNQQQNLQILQNQHHQILLQPNQQQNIQNLQNQQKQIQLQPQLNQQQNLQILQNQQKQNLQYQQNLQYLQYQQLLQAQQKQLNPHAKIKPQQPQLKPQIQQNNIKNIQQKDINKNQPQINYNPQHKIAQPKIQQQNIPHNHIPKQQIPMINPSQIHYHQQTQNQQNQTPVQNTVNIPYDKKNEHFVNKQIYIDNKIVPTANDAITKEIQKLNNNQNVPKGNLPVTNNVPQPNKDPIIEKKISDKYKNLKLSEIKEEEMNISQSGLSKKVSKINISHNSEEDKEFPMEEKKPETAFPENLMEENKTQNISQNSINESGISDIDSKLDHLPTIGSILRGNSEPLPPTKKKKYK